MHAKTYSEATTSHETASWPAKSPLQQPAYFVQSPPNPDVDKMSSGSGFSPVGSPNRHPNHHHSFDYNYNYYCYHRDSSVTSGFSQPLRNQLPRSYAGYSSLRVHHGRPIEDSDDDEMDAPDKRRARKVRFYLCLFMAFVLVFTLFCLILWGAARSFRPKVTLKRMVFESFKWQSGSDSSGVPTDMLNLNSTVKIFYRNPAAFFTVHVTSSPLELSYSHLVLASGQIEKFSQRRKSQRSIETEVKGEQVPLYGGIPVLSYESTQPSQMTLPLNLTFTLRSRAYILGRLVKTKFYSRFRCAVTLQGNKLGKTVDLSKSCSDHH